MSESQNTPPEKLIEWVRSLETVGCVRIEARHLTAGSESQSAVATFEIRATEDGDERFDAPTIFRRLEEDAETIGGVQRYTLLAFRDGGKAPRERLTLRVDGGTDEGAGGASEPANASGLVAQAHRHLEATMNMFARSVGASLQTAERTNKALLDELSELRAERTEVFALLKEVTRVDREGDAQRHALQLKEKQADVLRDGLKLLLPAIVTKVTQAAGMQPPPAAIDEGLRRFVESLTPAQQASIFSQLTPDQAVALGTVLESFIKKEGPAEGPSEKASPQ